MEGVITRIVPFGAFIQINDNIEGLIHISEISYDHIEKVENILKVGETVNAKIIKLIIDEQKIGLTLKYDTNNQGNGDTNTTEVNVTSEMLSNETPSVKEAGEAVQANDNSADHEAETNETSDKEVSDDSASEPVVTAADETIEDNQVENQKVEDNLTSNEGKSDDIESS